MPSPFTRWKRLPTFLLFVVLACATSTPGPPFEWAPLPPEHRGRVYLYRTDSRNSMAVVNATIDGQKVGTFRNRDYQTFEISAGSHKLRAGMRGFGFFTLGWNELTFRVRPGQTVFIHMSVRIESGSDSPLEAPRDLEIAGRSDNRFSENVFIGEKPRHEATNDLETTNRLSDPD